MGNGPPSFWECLRFEYGSFAEIREAKVHFADMKGLFKINKSLIAIAEF